MDIYEEAAIIGYHVLAMPPRYCLQFDGEFEDVNAHRKCLSEHVPDYHEIVSDPNGWEHDKDCPCRQKEA